MSADSTFRPRRFWRHRLPAFLLSSTIAVIWGTVVQTQFNLAELQGLGAEVALSVRLQTTAQDLLGFAPLYAIVVTVALALAYAVAGLLSARALRWRSALFAMAGGSGLIVAIRSVDALAPPPVLIAATRGSAGLLTMALGGVLSGLLYVRLTRARKDS